jgi:type 1 glutamine amidotransferase
MTHHFSPALYFPKFACIFCFSVLLLFPVYGQRKKPILVLIVDGFSNHNWSQTSKLTKLILEESKLFKVDISTIPTDSLSRASWNPPFNKYAVVIQNTNNIQNRSLKWPRSAESNLEQYVAKGGGLYILHSANNAFPHWEEYEKMIGMGWRPKTFGYALEINSEEEVVRIPPGEGQGTGHGNRFNARIQILKKHPINTGFPKHWQTALTEVYHYPRGLAVNLDVLSYAYDSTATKKMWPVEWVVAYGKGTVYNSSMGHLWKDETYPLSYRCIGFQTTMIRATEWLATGRVSYRVPTQFPTAEKVSLRAEDDFPR